MLHVLIHPMCADLEQALAKGLEMVGRGCEVPSKRQASQDASRSREELLKRIAQLEAELCKE